MAKTIYVGNLPETATEEEIRSLFAQHGAVISVNLITDQESGKPRGFGFVDMNEADAEAAIKALNGAELAGNSLQVNEARARSERR
jgi:RNA recognition motif-containing protein